MVDPNPWDQHRIKAELGRRGYTLTQVALEAGLSESACRVALRGASRSGAEALSRFLGEPLSVLFPGWYLRSKPTKGKSSRKAPPVSRQKNSETTDTARARA